MDEKTAFVVWDPRIKIVDAQSRQEALLVAQEQFKRSPPGTGDLRTETLDFLTTGPTPDVSALLDDDEESQVASSPEAAERMVDEPDEGKPLGEDPSPEVTDEEPDE